MCDLHYAAAATDPQLTQPHLQATNGRKTSDQWKKDMQRCAFHIRRKTCNDVFSHHVCIRILSKTTQALPAQSTHSSFSPESSDAVDPTQPLAKAADTATRGSTPQWHRLRSSKGDTPGKRIKNKKSHHPSWSGSYRGILFWPFFVALEGGPDDPAGSVGRPDE